MRVLELIDRASRGGAEKHTRLFSEELARQGHKVWLVHPGGPYTPDFAASSRHGVNVIELPALRSNLIVAVRLLRSLLAHEDIEVIHSHQYRADLVTALAASGQVLATTIHNFLGKDLPWTRAPFRRALYYPFSRFALSRMNLVIATSSYGAAYVRQFFGIDDERLKIILNSIDPAELSNIRPAEKTRAELELPRDRPLIACAATLEPRKGQTHLLRAIAKVCSEISEQHPVLLLLGEGPQERELTQLAKDLGIEDSVRLLGFRADAKDVIAACDVYIQPSLVDPLPRALLEAMFLRVPVIASNVDGIPDVVTNGRTGHLVPPADYRALALSILRVLRTDSSEVTGRAREFVLQRCTIGSMVRSFLEHVERIPRTTS
ncbi:MAG TPA: glycosyltransferase family 4 protein [Trueperaceae bacterium]